MTRIGKPRRIPGHDQCSHPLFPGPQGAALDIPRNRRLRGAQRPVVLPFSGRADGCPHGGFFTNGRFGRDRVGRLEGRRSGNRGAGRARRIRRAVGGNAQAGLSDPGCPVRAARFARHWRDGGALLSGARIRVVRLRRRAEGLSVERGASARLRGRACRSGPQVRRLRPFHGPRPHRLAGGADAADRVPALASASVRGVRSDGRPRAAGAGGLRRGRTARPRGNRGAGRRQRSAAVRIGRADAFQHPRGGIPARLDRGGDARRALARARAARASRHSSS